MIDDSLKLLFSFIKTVLKNAIKGEIWAIALVLVFLAILFLAYLQISGSRFLNRLNTKYHPYEEIYDDDDDK